MAKYLLGTQVLVDLARNDESDEIYRWMDREDLKMSAVAVSVMSFEVFAAHVDKLPAKDRGIWSPLLERQLRKFQRRGTILPVTLNVALQCAGLEALDLEEIDPVSGKRVAVDLATQLVASTAVVEGLTLCDGRQPYHDELETRGLSLLDPYS